MKKWIIHGILSLAALQPIICYGEATIKLSNLDLKLPIDFNSPAAVSAGNDFYVEILAGPIGGYLAPIPAYGTTNTVYKLDPNGLFDAGIGVVPGVIDNGYGEFRIRVWRHKPTYDVARSTGIITGLSYKWIQSVGSWDLKVSPTPSAPALQIKKIYYSGTLEPVIVIDPAGKRVELP